MVKKNIQITPWEVSGEIDYEKLGKQFGIAPLNDQLLKKLESFTKESHFMLRRKIFFAHRDLDWLLTEHKRGNKFFLYTGCGPSGPIHLGHLMIWNFVKWLQDKFNVELWFQFTDDEKFLFKDKSYEEIQEWTRKNMLDVIAVGFNPTKTHFIIDTKHAGLLYPEAIKFAKKITFSTVKASFGFDNQKNIGQIFYTAMQAVLAILPSVLQKKNIPCLIPLAVDQDPHFRVARDVYSKLGYYKPSIIHGTFLPPLSGAHGKMSSTTDSAIYTTDSPQEVERKIKKCAFSGGRDTLEEHRKKGGNPDIDVCFQYLRMFFEPDDNKLKQIEQDYRSGKLTTGELKNYTIKKINSFLAQHQKRLASAKSKLDKFIYSH